MTIMCTFCGKSSDMVARVVAGPGVYICNECVQLCIEVMEVEGQIMPPNWHDTMTDEQILEHLPKVAAAETTAAKDLQTWVDRLRERNVTWERIGGALSMTRQSAWERFSRNGG
jgi:ATP-dependent protease Clp ATPase subunit